MKRFSRILCCLIVLMLVFSSCNDTEHGADDKQTVQGNDTETPKELADPMMLISNGEAKCTITKPKDCSEVITEAIDTFVKSVKKKTGVQLPVVDEASEISTDYEIAVNSTNGRDPLSEQLENTAYTDYKIGIWDWHIMVTARSDKAVSAALKKISSSLEELENGYCIREDFSAQASVTLGERKTSVPVYDTQKGKELPLYSVDGGYEVCIQNTNKDEFLAYAEKLVNCGFTKYSENAISAGKSVAESNLSYVYTAEDIYVFMNWNVSQKTARVVYTEPTELPELTKPVLTSDDTAKTSVAQIGIAGLGMSYAIQLKDYSFIVIDGGTNADSNVKMLYDYMVEKTPSGKKPTIACWIFTHPDPDHIGAPTSFLNKYMEEVELKSVACNFPDCTVQDTSQNDDTIGASIFTLENIVNRFYDAKIYTIHTGQKFYFKGVEMEILMTEEDVYPMKVESYNYTSAMMRFTFDNGKTFMVLGDGTEKVCKQLSDTYKDYTKSDILQLAHHGLIGGNEQLYRYIDPEICFWSTSKERFEGKYDTNKDGTVNAKDVQHCLGQGGCGYNAYIRNDSIRKRTHYHGGETFVVEID